MYTAAASFSFALLLATAGLCAWLFVRNRALGQSLREKEKGVETSSRLLIQKNIELFDQNISQQKQLASKDDFIAIASHQLRTPVNEIKWGLAVLLGKPAGVPPSREELQGIAASASKMEAIIEGLLDFVVVEQGHARLAVSAYDPEKLVRETAERIAKDFAGRDIQLSLDLRFGGTIDSIDSAALEMVLSNLVENAFHYTPPPGTITVSTARGADGAFEVVVQDSGMGISSDMAQHIFVKFRRSPQAIERNASGSGLGLYIVKTLLDRWGGTVSFASKEGDGSTFRFSLPKKKSSTAGV